MKRYLFNHFYFHLPPTADHAFNFHDKSPADSNMLYSMGCGDRNNRAQFHSDMFLSKDYGSRCFTSRMDVTTDCLVNPSKCEHGFTIAFWSESE